MSEYTNYKSTLRYGIPDIEVLNRDNILIKIGSANIETLKIKSIENIICESKIFECIKKNGTFSGGTKILCRYIKGLNDEYLKVQSYWNSEEIDVELNSKSSNPQHEKALDLVNKIEEIIVREEDIETIKKLFNN